MNTKSWLSICTLTLFWAISVFGQHRGDQLSFQGVDFLLSEGPRNLAVGTALTSARANFWSVYFNPAGLAGIDRWQSSLSFSNTSSLWRENQRYRPNRQFTTLSFYLDGLYTPDPKNNNRWDYEVFQEDTNYQVLVPEYGVDEYSKAAADWQKEQKKSSWQQFMAALPLTVFNQKLVLAGAFNRLPLLDYDRNDTYLDPHIGTNQYNEIPGRVVGEQDSVRMNWYTYERLRTGDVYTLRGAVAYQLTDQIDLGLGFRYLTGKSDDRQTLDKVGYFDLMGGYNQFKFSYDTAFTEVKGQSKYKGLGLSIGALYHLEKMSLGINVELPWTITRDWTYTQNVDGQVSKIKGQDKLKLGLAYAAGISFYPNQAFTLRLDVRKNNYADNSFTLAASDSTFRSWTDQLVLSAGMEYRILPWLQLNGGYETFGEVFVPDGNGVTSRGPASAVYTLGCSIFALRSRIDVTYRHKTYKYADIYYTNTNYNFFQRDLFVINYGFNF